VVIRIPDSKPLLMKISAVVYELDQTNLIESTAGRVCLSAIIHAVKRFRKYGADASQLDTAARREMVYVTQRARLRQIYKLGHVDQANNSIIHRRQ
jgi:hypothetical protein